MPTRSPSAERSVVLLSGGMDSATCLAFAARQSASLHALTVFYGQRHERELASARSLARHFSLTHHEILRLPSSHLFRSALTNRRARIPTSRRSALPRIPPTYVPARNTVLLALALGYAESHGLDAIYLGVNAVDYSGYPDCRPEYLRAFGKLARLATKAAVEGEKVVKIEAPLLYLSKLQIVRLGERLGVPWGKTWSCYRGGRIPCGRCDACRLRAKGFDGAGIPDPLLSRHWQDSAGRSAQRTESG